MAVFEATALFVVVLSSFWSAAVELLPIILLLEEEETVDIWLLRRARNTTRRAN